MVMLLYMGGVFVCNTYIGPLLRHLVGAEPNQLSLLLIWFGVVAIAGNLLGGQTLDRLGSERALGLGLLGLASGMTLLTTSGGSLIASVAFLGLWGLSGFSLMAPQQARLVQLGGERATALLSLNASMLYLGTALGSLVGGAALPLVGYAGLGPVGATLVLLALGCVWLSRPKQAF